MFELLMCHFLLKQNRIFLTCDNSMYTKDGIHNHWIFFRHLLKRFCVKFLIFQHFTDNTRFDRDNPPSHPIQDDSAWYLNFPGQYGLGMTLEKRSIVFFFSGDNRSECVFFFCFVFFIMTECLDKQPTDVKTFVHVCSLCS